VSEFIITADNRTKTVAIADDICIRATAKYFTHGGIVKGSIRFKCAASGSYQKLITKTLRKWGEDLKAYREVRHGLEKAMRTLLH
jgi:hypothetical protein